MNAISKLWSAFTYLADAAHALGDTLKEVNAGVRQQVGLDDAHTNEPIALETNGTSKRRIGAK